MYEDSLLDDSPPAVINISKIIRYILADNPRVTRFTIDWTSSLEAKDQYLQEREEMFKNAPSIKK